MSLEATVEKLLNKGYQAEAHALVRTAALSRDDWERFVSGFERKISYKLRPCTPEEYGQHNVKSREDMRKVLEESSYVLMDYLLEKHYLRPDSLTRARIHSGSPHHLGEQTAALLLGLNYTKKNRWDTAKDLWVLSRTPDVGTATSSFHRSDLQVLPVDEDLRYYAPEKLQAIREEIRQNPKTVDWIPLSLLPENTSTYALAWESKWHSVDSFWAEGPLLKGVRRMLHDPRVKKAIEDLRSCKDVGL